MISLLLFCHASNFWTGTVLFCSLGFPVSSWMVWLSQMTSELRVLVCYNLSLLARFTVIAWTMQNRSGFQCVKFDISSLAARAIVLILCCARTGTRSPTVRHFAVAYSHIWTQPQGRCRLPNYFSLFWNSGAFLMTWQKREKGWSTITADHHMGRGNRQPWPRNMEFQVW